jgi:hypothetical protein
MSFFEDSEEVKIQDSAIIPDATLDKLEIAIWALKFYARYEFNFDNGLIAKKALEMIRKRDEQLLVQ